MACLASRAGVLAVALVGSRAGADPSRIDRFSDADFLVCCDDTERERILAGDWVESVATPLLVFPRIMDDEVRVLFPGLFACELHLLSPEQVDRLSGPCELGSRIASGIAVLHDPDGRLGRLVARVRPEPPEPRNPAAASSVFWYNAAYASSLVLRGDLFRAGRYTNWFLQLFLLNLLYSIEDPDATKYVARKITSGQYRSLASTVSPLDQGSMIEGLRRCMRCYWEFQSQVAPELDLTLLASFRVLEQEIELRLRQAVPSLQEFRNRD